ncbi:proteophosphoglycan ppg4 [Rhodotorula toruloides]|uniref:Proteophosphoglycan ppg4 n=1 Tax=Rhodotorula toruloides TaxID=5286 RepID=A0A511KB47_RHOTO|nr:proteophosphoglycan ppg4 [Rhodotorula toruloides]
MPRRRLDPLRSRSDSIHRPYPLPNPAPVPAESDPVPSTSTAPRFNPERKLACLANLPPELKTLIVRKVAEVDMEAAEGDWDDESEEGSTISDEGLDEGRANSRKKKALEKWGQEQLSMLEKREQDGEDFDEDGNPTLASLEMLRQRLIDAGCPDESSSGIIALSLVSREFNELASPFMWEAIDFEDRSNETIIDCINVILPKHARHVKVLEFGQAEDRMLRVDFAGAGFGTRDPFRPIRRTHLPIVEEAERLGGVTTTYEDGERLLPAIRELRTRSLLLAEVVRLCPNVIEINCETCPKTYPQWTIGLDRLPPRDLERLVYRTDHALEAVKKHLAHQLVDLTLVVNGEDEGATTECDLASILAVCSNLVRLDIDCFAPTGSYDERRALFRAFEQLKKLEILTIQEGMFVNDEFAALDWQCPLRVLALSSADDLSFPSFWDLIHKFTSTLECLDIDGVPHTNVEQDNKKFVGRHVSLSRLDTLVISTQHESAFLLESFVQCPIRTFGLGFCPAVSYADIERFVALHAQTLKRVEVKHDAALTEAQVESLEVYCHAKGIECELLEDDESSSEEQDDSSEGEDEDALDHDEWVEEDEDAGSDWGSDVGAL